MSEMRPAADNDHPLVTNYSADLQDRTTLRGYHLLNMMRNVPFGAKLGAEWYSDNPPQPWGKLWQETKNLIVECEVPFTNHRNLNQRVLDVVADIDAAELLRCVRNRLRPLFNPLLDALLKWEAANPAQASRPTDEQVHAVIAPEKERRRKSQEGWNIYDARDYGKAMLPGATNEQIRSAYNADGEKFTPGRKRGNRAK